MRRPIVLLVIPLLLAACDQNPPASDAAASTEAAPVASEPAQQQPADSVAPAESDIAPIVGRWSYDGPACTGPTQITADTFEGAENSCTFDNLSVGEDGTITASMSCSSQGETSKEQLAMTPIFGPAGEGIRLNYLDRGGDPVNVFRCAK